MSKNQFKSDLDIATSLKNLKEELWVTHKFAKKDSDMYNVYSKINSCLFDHYPPIDELPKVSAISDRLIFKNADGCIFSVSINNVFKIKNDYKLFEHSEEGSWWQLTKKESDRLDHLFGLK